MKLKKFTVLRIRTTTKVEVAEIEINARDEADALVLARYKLVPSYYFHEDYDQAGTAEHDELKPAEPEAIEVLPASSADPESWAEPILPAPSEAAVSDLDDIPF